MTEKSNKNEYIEYFFHTNLLIKIYQNYIIDFLTENLKDDFNIEDYNFYLKEKIFNKFKLNKSFISIVKSLNNIDIYSDFFIVQNLKIIKRELLTLKIDDLVILNVKELSSGGLNNFNNKPENYESKTPSFWMIEKEINNNPYKLSRISIEIEQNYFKNIEIFLLFHKVNMKSNKDFSFSLKAECLFSIYDFENFLKFLLFFIKNKYQNFVGILNKFEEEIIKNNNYISKIIYEDLFEKL